jgi:hypothetical protein
MQWFGHVKRMEYTKSRIPITSSKLKLKGKRIMRTNSTAKY